MQVSHAADLAAQGFSSAADVAHEAYRVPVEAVTKPIKHYFGGSSDTADSQKSDDDGHAMRPLLSSLQEQQEPNANGRRQPGVVSSTR